VANLDLRLSAQVASFSEGKTSPFQWKVIICVFTKQVLPSAKPLLLYIDKPN